MTRLGKSMGYVKSVQTLVIIMVAQIFAGLFTEGQTDIRFLQNIVQKTLEAVAFDDCSGQFDIELTPITINKTGLGFIEQVLEASKKGQEEFGMMIFCVQADADRKTLKETYQHKINPCQVELEKQHENDYCKILVAVVPIQETEAWMLADKDLLKEEIGTNKTDKELGINRNPETIANPKEVIEKAIQIARKNLTRKRRKDLTIAGLYSVIGQKIELEKLESLSSYQDFKENVREVFRKLNLLY
jgi:hypothetical protein